jgi:hypothetical protein
MKYSFDYQGFRRFPEIQSIGSIFAVINSRILVIVPYQVTDSDPNKTKYLTWFVNFAAVPAVRWTVLPELHLGASFGIGIGIFTPPSKTNLQIPWAGNEIKGALTIIHLRPALSLEYLPLDWLGIVVTPLAIDIDIPYSSAAASKTAALFRYDAFLGVAFHI